MKNISEARKMCKEFANMRRLNSISSSRNLNKKSNKTQISLLLFFLIIFPLEGSSVIVSIHGLGDVQGKIDGSSYAYLKIPYAKPPIGPLRFMPPERHDGWNRTLIDSDYSQWHNCIQPTAREKMVEDCLFINVWTPQSTSSYLESRQRSLLPVVIFIGGELYNFYDTSLVNGAEFAANQLIFVSFNYRLGVFGFFSMEDSKAGGNMGLLDQYLAIEWVHENIHEFGGDPSKVTLMGHSAGAASALFHITSPRAAGRFQNVILLSGSSLAPWALGYHVKEASARFARDVGCSSYDTNEILTCLRYKSTTELSQAAYRVTDYYNGTDVWGPVVDLFLPKDLQYLGRSPSDALERGEFPNIPIISGISSKDGLLFIKRKSQLYRMGALELKETFENSLIPELLERSRLNRNWLIVKEVVKFAFITGAANETQAVMDQMLDFFTEANFLAPHIQTSLLLSRHSNPVYAYVFDVETPDPNIYSSSINSTGAGHSAILSYLFGRNIYRKNFGSEYNSAQRIVSERLIELLVNFIGTGVPTQSRGHSWNTWSRFSGNEQRHFWVKDERTTGRGYQPYRTQFWTEFLPRLNNLGLGGGYDSPQEFREGASPVYKSATWVLLAILLVLLALILIAFSILKRRRKEEGFTSRETTPDLNGSRSPIPSPSPHPSRSGRRARGQDPGVTILY